MSVAVTRASATTFPRILSRTTVTDLLLLSAVFTITLANIRWRFGTTDINLSDILTSFFVLSCLFSWVVDRYRLWPRTTFVVAGFLLLFAVVNLLGYFSLETVADRDQWSRGMVKFLIHFIFLIAAVTHLARRTEIFYWRVLAWFTAGVIANGAYGLVELGYAELAGGNLDRLLLTPIGSFLRGGINVYGAIEGSNVFRPNALTLDPNHLGIMLIVPILILLPIYLRLEKGHRLRVPLALSLVFLSLVELATLSRSGILGIVIGIGILVVPYLRQFASVRMVAPLVGLFAVVAVIVARRADFFAQVLRSRTSVNNNSTRIHLEFYELLGPVMRDSPVFGLGLNTFSTYFEFITGRSNFGPHSYYVSVLTETGIIGGVIFLAWMFYLLLRLRLLHQIGRNLLAVGDRRGALVRPLAFGLTAAFVGTLVANAFYLTMQFYYFYVLALLIIAAPLVFNRRSLYS